MNQTHGLRRRPGESPPLPSPAAIEAARYFAGHLATAEIDDLQEHLAHDPAFAAELLDWNLFAAPSSDEISSTTLASWLNEDRARLERVISDERAARKEAARLLGLTVAELDVAPLPSPASPTAEEDARARWAIELLEPLAAAARLEMVRRQPEELGGVAVASACLTKARAALPASPRESDSWAEVASLAADLTDGANETGNARGLALLHLRAKLYRANALRTYEESDKAAAAFREIAAAAGRQGVTDLVFWAEFLGFSASLKRNQRNFTGALRDSGVATVLWEHADDRVETMKLHWLAATIHEQAGDFPESIAAISLARELARELDDRSALFHIQHSLVTSLARAGRAPEAASLLAEIRPEYQHHPHAANHLPWVTGLVAVASGESHQAQAAFRTARDGFLEAERPYNAALVTLDWTLLLLDEVRVDEVLPLALSMGRAFEALGVARETLAAWAILLAAAERGELTRALVAQVSERLPVRLSTRRSSSGTTPLGSGSAIAENRPPTEPSLFRRPVGDAVSETLKVETSAAYFSGRLGAPEIDALQERLARDPAVADALLDWHRFSPPAPELVSTETLSAWQAEDHTHLRRKIEDAPVAAAVLEFRDPPPPARPRPVWKALAAAAGLAASLAAVTIVTAPVVEERFIPASTLRSDDQTAEITTVTLGRWPHRVRFEIDVGTLDPIESPRVLLLDSQTRAVVATTPAEAHDGTLTASFWGLDPGSYELQIEGTAAGIQRLVAYHPVDIRASDASP